MDPTRGLGDGADAPRSSREASSRARRRKTHMDRKLVAVPLVLFCLATAGCGYSEDEWKAQLDKYAQLKSQSEAKQAELDKELAAAKQRVADLEKELTAKGIDLSKMSEQLDDREKALAEYKARARQLEAIKARFDLLRKKLESLVQLGLDVNIRHNRMVISLPGDVLFDTGKDTLKKDGEDILKKIAAVIKGDRALADRDYQVAGHTDTQPLRGGEFHDNWGLSLMRSRSVLLFLIGKGGNLPRQHWSAAGFADTDPVAPNTTKDGQQKNRRCDLIIVPDVDEMIDLTKIAK
jgi:chemotaxis protein MotB